MKTASQRWIVITFFLLAAIGSLLFLQISKYIQETTLFIPALNIQMETIHILILLVYTLCIIKSTSNHWYFMPLVVFILIQLFYSAWCLINKSRFIEFQLNACWNEAKHATLYQIQSEYHCQGFFHTNDRSISTTKMVTDACFPLLYNAFGDAIYIWGIALFIIKVIQAMGLMLCFAIHHHPHDSISIMQQEDLDEKEIALP